MLADLRRLPRRHPDNFGGEDVCLLWETFAAYGLGTDAVSGGSSSTSPTNGFAIPAACQCAPFPTADAGPDQTICQGDSTTVGTPAPPDNSYAWSPGGETTAEITVSPLADTTYTVTATTAACGSNSDSATVLVDDGTRAGLDDNFEGDVSGWTATGLWHRVTSSSCTSPENGYTSAFNAFYYGQDSTCTYDTGGATSGSLISPPIFNVTASSTLSFEYYRQVESFSGDFDRTTVDVVTGSSRTTVFSLNSSSASQATWVSSGPIDLSAFAGQVIQLELNFDSGDGVSNTFTGDATDAEDGDLTASLAWTSDLDDAIGSGGSFTTSGLSVGSHTITASVTDSGGASGSDSVQITVAGLCAPKGASCTVNADCCSNKCRGKSGAMTCK